MQINDQAKWTANERVGWDEGVVECGLLLWLDQSLIADGGKLKILKIYLYKIEKQTFWMW